MKALMTLMLVSSFFSQAAMAQDGVASHCKENEFSIVDAWVGELMTKPVNDSYVNKQNRKLLSLCADTEKEPYSKISYRYGTANKVEMEYTADSTKPMYFDSINLGKIGNEIYFFQRANFTYYVSIHFAMGSGVSLQVYDGKKRIVKRFSGNDEGQDYTWSGEIIDSSKRKLRSPALQLMKPRHPVTDD